MRANMPPVWLELQSSTKVLAHRPLLHYLLGQFITLPPSPQFNVVYCDKVIIARLQHCRGVSLLMMPVMRYKCLVNAFSCYLIQVCQGLLSMIVFAWLWYVQRENPKKALYFFFFICDGTAFGSTNKCFRVLNSSRFMILHILGKHAKAQSVAVLASKEDQSKWFRRAKDFCRWL